MSEEFGPTFITLTDEDGNNIELEHLDTLERNGVTYMAFFPVLEEGAAEDGDEAGLILLKVVEENGEELLATIDDDDELDAVYEQFMETLFDEDED